MKARDLMFVVIISGDKSRVLLISEDGAVSSAEGGHDAHLLLNSVGFKSVITT